MNRARGTSATSALLRLPRGATYRLADNSRRRPRAQLERRDRQGPGAGLDRAPPRTRPSRCARRSPPPRRSPALSMQRTRRDSTARSATCRTCSSGTAASPRRANRARSPAPGPRWRWPPPGSTRGTRQGRAASMPSPSSSRTSRRGSRKSSARRRSARPPIERELMVVNAAGPAARLRRRRPGRPAARRASARTARFPHVPGGQAGGQRHDLRDPRPRPGRGARRPGARSRPPPSGWRRSSRSDGSWSWKDRDAPEKST